GVGLRLARADQAAEPWDGAATVGDVLRRVNPALSDSDVWRVTASVGVPSGPARPLADLSGGERRRLTLASIAVADAHLLVLDEPTHHLDLRPVEALEALLESFTGTLLFATHDRRVVERLATTVWRFDQRGLDAESVTPGREVVYVPRVLNLVCWNWCLRWCLCTCYRSASTGIGTTQLVEYTPLH